MQTKGAFPILVIVVLSCMVTTLLVTKTVGAKAQRFYQHLARRNLGEELQGGSSSKAGCTCMN